MASGESNVSYLSAHGRRRNSMEPTSHDWVFPEINLHGISAGSGPLVVCTHGITANAWVYQPLMDALSDRFRVVSIDQRGHGRSGKPRGDYSAAHYADDIVALVRELGGPALLIGHSLGARNSLVAGWKHPELVSGVVAVDFVPFIEDQVFSDLEARVGGGDKTFSSQDEIRAYLGGRYTRLPSDAIGRRAQHGYVQADRAWKALADPAAMKQTCVGLREDLAPALSGVTVPILLVRGRDSKLVSPWAWARAKALRPELPAIELDADHYVVEEAHQALAAEVSGFYKTHCKKEKQA